MTNPNRVRDHREPGHFWADNEVVDLYLPTIGAYGFAVYMLLTRFANHKTGQCDPSVTTIAKTLGISAPTAKKALDALKEAGLITILHRSRQEEGRLVNETNVYTLLAVPKGRGTQGDLVPKEIAQGVPKEVGKGTQGGFPGVPNDVCTNNKDVQKESPPPTPIVISAPIGGGDGGEKPNGKTELYYWMLDFGVKSSTAALQVQHHDPELTKAMFQQEVGNTSGDERERRIGRVMKALKEDGPRVRKRPAAALPIVPPAPDRPDPAESRRKTAELMRQQRGH